MTEEQWLTATDPRPLWEYLQGKASDRKLRLFAVAVCYLASGETAVPMFEEVVRLAEGLATVDEVRGYWLRPGEVRRGAWPERPFEWALDLVQACADPDKRLWGVSYPAGDQLPPILRDVFGNPFRPPTRNPSWLTPDVLSLAQAAYEERELPQGLLDPARLSVLADALEDVGCRDQAILNHLRGPGPHVRGCWVIDLLVGKE